MGLPFTQEQFIGVFQQYNQAIWPMQVIAYLIGVAAIALALRTTRYSGPIIGGILAFFWLWNGIAYHILSFSPINPAAKVFGGLFALQSILWLISLVVRPGHSFRPRSDALSLFGWAFVIYAMIVYPIIGTLSGHGYPNSPAFGLAPCPTTIFTFGLLLWANQRVSKYLLVIPLIWSIIGFGAALSLGIREDFGLLVAGMLGTSLILWRDSRRSSHVAAENGLRERRA